MGDNGDGSVKNLKQWVTSFIDGPWMSPNWLISSQVIVTVSYILEFTNALEIFFLRLDWKFLNTYENSTKIRRLCDCQNSNKFAKNLGRYYMIFQTTTIIILHYFIQGRSSQKKYFKQSKTSWLWVNRFMANYVWIFFSLRCAAAAAYLSCCHIKSIFLDVCIYSINLQYDNHNVCSSFFVCLLFDNLFFRRWDIFFFRNN